MKMTRFNDFLTKIDLTALYNYIMEHGVTRTYRRDEVLCEQGTVCRTIGIVKSGYCKYSVINSGGETCITGFAFEGDVVTDYVGSFLFNNAAFTSISAGCNAEVLQVDIGAARRFMNDTHPGLNDDACRILLAGAYRRYLDLHTKTAKERYCELSAHCHGDLSQIPLKEIASYLAISRRHLQRIRESLL